MSAFLEKSSRWYKDCNIITALNTWVIMNVPRFEVRGWYYDFSNVLKEIETLGVDWGKDKSFIFNNLGRILGRTNLQGAFLQGANLQGANLYEAYLSGAYLSGANLYGANLYGANLYGAILSGAILSGANLSGANLSGANLSGANLPRSNLQGADLYGANLSEANLSGAYRPSDPPKGWKADSKGYLIPE